MTTTFRESLRKFRRRAALIALARSAALMVPMAMLGNIIAYGFEHGVTHLKVTGSIAALCILIYGLTERRDRRCTHHPCQR